MARRPVVALIATGDELVMPGEDPGPDQIVSSNGIGLKAMLEAAGADARLLPIARDTPESLAACFALAEGADLIVTLGGASVGDFDLVQKTALAHGMALDFYRVAMRPGKAAHGGPARAACRWSGCPATRSRPWSPAGSSSPPRWSGCWGCPGTCRPCTRRGSPCALGPNGPRAHYMRARVEPGGGGWGCTPFERQDSSLLSVLADANALMLRPPHDPARQPGDTVEFLWL